MKNATVCASFFWIRPGVRDKFAGYYLTSAGNFYIMCSGNLPRKDSTVLNNRIATLILSLCLVLTLVPALASPASAIGEEMKVSRGTPFVDGEIDPVWKTAARQKLSHRTGGEGRADTSLCYVSVLWDDEALYFLFELIDNNFTFDAPAGSELNDHQQ